MKSNLLRLFAAAMMVASLGLSACSVSNTDPSKPDNDSAASTSLPADIQSQGYIDVGAFAPYPPYAVSNGNDLEGLEPDLIRAVAAKLGVQVRFQTLEFESMIPSLLTGRVDMLVGPLFDTAERRAEVSFIDIYSTAAGVLVREGNPAAVDPLDRCGHVAAALAGTVFVDLDQQAIDQCEAEGKPSLKMLTFDDDAQARLAVSNGRADYYLTDPVVARQQASADSGLEVLQQLAPYEGASHQGWVFPKDQTGLRTAFVGAMEELIADGSWEDLISELDLEGYALDQVLVNGQKPTSDQ